MNAVLRVMGIVILVSFVVVAALPSGNTLEEQNQAIADAVKNYQTCKKDGEEAQKKDPNRSGGVTCSAFDERTRVLNLVTEDATRPTLVYTLENRKSACAVLADYGGVPDKLKSYCAFN